MRLIDTVRTSSARRGESRQLCGAARLVGIGFRGWMTGLATGDIRQFEAVWERYRAELGAAGAVPLVSRLAAWVKATQGAAHRPINLKPMSACRFCHDECIAVTLIAAAQADTCPAMRACAFALLGNSEVDGVIAGAEGFARSLADEGLTVAFDGLDPSAAVVSAGPADAGQMRLQ